MIKTNTQNVPRSLKVVKQGFIPKLDAFLFSDYSSVEVRLLAFYLASIGDESIADEFKKGLDPHVETAKMLFPDTEIGDEQRQIAKTLNFAIIYGGGTPTIMRQLGSSYQESRTLLRSFHEARPGIAELGTKIKAVYADRGYIKTLWGRRLRPQDDHKALNALIQGCAADLMRDALVKVHHILGEPWYESHLVNVVHDELQLDIRMDELDSIIQWLPEQMRDGRIHEVVPIEVSMEISQTNWAEKEELVA